MVQVQARHHDHIGSAMKVHCFIKIYLQKCLEQNKLSIVNELDILSKANVGTWEGYGYFKEDLALYLCAYERAAGLGYGEADQEFLNQLLTNQAAMIREREVNYPHGQ